MTMCDRKQPKAKTAAERKFDTDALNAAAREAAKSKKYNKKHNLNGM